jgi:subtilisin family serine protease
MKFILSACLLVLLSSVHSAPAGSKIDWVLKKTLSTKARANILVSMKETTHAALEQVSRGTYSTRGARAQAVYDALNNLAAESQKNVLEMLNSPRFFAITTKTLWISNQIYIQGADAYLVDSLAAMDEVAKIDEEVIVYLDDPVEGDADVKAEWGVEKIRAPQAWSAGGTDGAGATVCVIDTGLRYTHMELRDAYKGDSRSWYNPYSKTQFPGDGHGHGTHCSGTVAGASGLGVAPGAKLIECKGLQDNGSGSNAALLECAQFATCPTDYMGNNPDCNAAPDAASNSWGGGAGNNWYDAAIRAWHAAGVVPVFANGNNGASCSTSISPGDTNEQVISVGATTSTDTIASFSSRGPSFSGQQKPDVSAPGNQVVSAGIASDTARATMSGTSMACPHVAGLVALLRARNPNMSFATIKNVIQATAVAGVSSGQTCAGVPDTAKPNYTFGHGRIDALNAINAIAKM